MWVACYPLGLRAVRSFSIMNLSTTGVAHPISENAAAEFRRVMSMGVQDVWLCKFLWGKENGEKFSVVLPSLKESAAVHV